jgi:hypothetical protein
MEAIVIESNLTGRVTRIQLTADSFEDQRILKMIIDGLASGGTLFELSKDGEPCGAFRFGDCRKVIEDSEGGDSNE